MFSKKIRDLMIEQDISLQKLADTSGVPFETLRNIYYQKVKDPKVSTAFQLAQALGVTVEYLLGENINSLNLLSSTVSSIARIKEISSSKPELVVA